MYRRKLIKKISIIVIVSILLLWGLYVYHFNKKSLALDEIPVESFAIGEKVEFEHNYCYGSYLDGYAIKATSFQLMDTANYLKKFGMDSHSFENCPEKVGIVDITIFNDGGENEYEQPEGLLVDVLYLYGTDFYCSQNRDFFKLENPQLGDNNGIVLNKGESCNITLVYSFYKQDFNVKNWNHMNAQKMCILLTGYPVQKDIVLQSGT